MKKVLSLVLLLILIFSISVPAFATEVSDGTVVVRTWTNGNGENVTGIITKGSSTLAARTDSSADKAARGFITGASESPKTTTHAYDEYQVSDYFFMQIYNSNNQVISKYKVTLTGMVSRVSSDRRITSVSFSRVNGDSCSTSSNINGYTAVVKITHPIEGSLSAYFTLGSGGSFSVY